MMRFRRHSLGLSLAGRKLQTVDGWECRKKLTAL